VISRTSRPFTVTSAKADEACTLFPQVLEDFPSVQLPLEWVLQVVPRLKTRSFSIASSLRAHANQAHVTLAVVKWVTKFKRSRLGLCSTWLSQLDPSTGMRPIFIVGLQWPDIDLLPALLATGDLLS
jgi:sulfite reductase alpha subunit-like flavoprotein